MDGMRDPMQISLGCLTIDLAHLVEDVAGLVSPAASQRDVRVDSSSPVRSFHRHIDPESIAQPTLPDMVRQPAISERVTGNPFGITVVDESRTIYAQVPIQARFADGSEIAHITFLALRTAVFTTTETST